jgi:hypothetical protein
MVKGAGWEPHMDARFPNRRLTGSTDERIKRYGTGTFDVPRMKKKAGLMH